MYGDMTSAAVRSTPSQRVGKLCLGRCWFSFEVHLQSVCA